MSSGRIIIFCFTYHTRHAFERLIYGYADPQSDFENYVKNVENQARKIHYEMLTTIMLGYDKAYGAVVSY